MNKVETTPLVGYTTYNTKTQLTPSTNNIHTQRDGTGSWGLHQTTDHRKTNVGRDDQQRTTRDVQETRNSQRLNLTSALIYTGRNRNLFGNWGREEELTIKREWNTHEENYQLNRGDALRRQNDAQALNI